MTPLAAELARRKADIIADYRRHRNPQVFFREYGAALAQLLAGLWQALPDTEGLCLLATGGFGRGEIYPFSDIDLALAADAALTPAQQSAAEMLVQQLWDCGLAPALKSGSIAELCASAAADLTGDTALLESRLLCGDAGVAQRLARALDLQRDVVGFIEGKLLEMQQRHAKAQAGSLLEPNVKTCPGGLRDIHTMLWLAQVQGMAPQSGSLVQRRILSRTEWGVLMNSHRRLARIRIELHLAAGRAEERLIFDLQLQVAAALGHHDAEAHRRSEQLMRTLYRATKAVKQLNGILLPMLRGRVYSVLPRVVRDIDADYYQVGNLLAVKDKTIFRRQPSHIFKILSLWQQHSDVSGLAPQTLRAWWQAAQKQVNAAFYANPVNRGRFVGFFRHGGGLTHLLRFLNLYGVLGRYLPEWSRIVGLLQHDLFHVYPVDDHILMVVRNMRRLALDAHSHELPFASGLMAAFGQPHILYLAALFHDIAKGRGGDHAQLGIADARRFAADHFLSAEEGDLLAWLVEDHLLMSLVAQKEDIHNPEVVARFCRRVGSQERLSALYLLTVADIRGTNPKIWNSWKAGLLESLYRLALAHFQGKAADSRLAVSRRQESARVQLEASGLDEAGCRRLWQLLGPAYFVRHDESVINWHMSLIAGSPEQPQAHMRFLPDTGGLQVLVLMPNRERLFAGLCRLFGHHNLSILSAQAYVTDHNHILDTFVLQLPPGCDAADQTRIRRRLQQALNGFVLLKPQPQRDVSQAASRRLRHLPIAPRILLSAEEAPGEYVLEIIAANRRFLLADIADVLSELNISLRHAKIATLDERVEDSFLIRHPQLDQTAFQLLLKQKLLEKIGT
ncbi:[protein-PII] uridylyltransferase [Neisseria shayeganii]|uniref:Bifunctional uridylyltransferase/uridylyl-removing enzyme n=1 Tax=Neisseria shayeganii TaxID=607712 RepID=A0A7D7N4T6_9NEIS|nr:[protein-PII] uridylyltransferase [Neisseria shayeganii]QMT41545.1 [protein-PII] uridylyltransferase [Neisseria shayeganii]